jgi:hypothetical protein
VLVDEAHELAVHLAGEHHPHDVHRLGRRHAVAAAELARDAEPFEHRRDLRPTAVHHDRTDPRVPQVHHVLGEGALQLGAHHRVAAELHHHDLAVVALQPGQRLDECRGLPGRVDRLRLLVVVGFDGLARVVRVVRLVHWSVAHAQLA